MRKTPSMHAVAFLLVALAVGISPRQTAASEPPPARRNGGYVHISPGLFGFMPQGHTVLPTWPIGADAGWHLRRGRLFTSQIGVFVDDEVMSFDPPAHEVSAGMQVRLGATVDDEPPIFIYGAAAVGPTITVFRSERWVGPGALIGPGIQSVFGRHFTLGVEPCVALGGEMWIQLRARAFIGARF